MIASLKIGIIGTGKIARIHAKTGEGDASRRFD